MRTKILHQAEGGEGWHDFEDPPQYLHTMQSAFVRRKGREVGSDPPNAWCQHGKLASMSLPARARR